MSSCPDFLINSEFVYFSFLGWICMTRSILLCVCYFSLQWKGTYSSTNQSLHIRVTINCFCLIIQIVLMFAFVLFFSKFRTQKVSFPLVFPQMFGLWFSLLFLFLTVLLLICFCFYWICSPWVSAFLFLFGCLFCLLYLKKVSFIYNSLSNICLEKTNWWKNERLHFDLACNLLI